MQNLGVNQVDTPRSLDSERLGGYERLNMSIAHEGDRPPRVEFGALIFLRGL